MKLSARAVFTLVVAFLFLSGVAGLVYEIVWARYLALFLGHTSYAIVVVLVAFMGGLAIGNAWLGRRADTTTRPLAFYAWLEIGIGLYAIAFPPYYSACHDFYVLIARSWQPGGTGLLALKFTFSLLTILLPTVLMGGTLPLLVRLVTRSLGELRERVAALYFINSAGAVLGCWLADFWWIEALGLEATLLAAAAINLVVGALALLVSGGLREGRGDSGAGAGRREGAATATEGLPTECYPAPDWRLALLAIGASGFVAMLYQVAWTRLLALVLGSSTHAFSLMLLTFIAGISAGSYVISRWRSLRRSLEAFGWAEVVLAATLAGTMCLYQFLPYWFCKAAELVARRPGSYPLYAFLQGLICFGVMIVPTMCLGAILPLATRVATTDPHHAGSSVGRVFAVNTLGTVLGAALTGLWLMPRLGLARTFALGIALSAFIGVVILTREIWRRRRLWLLAVPVGVAAVVVAAGLAFDARWRNILIMGFWRLDTAPPSWEIFAKAAQDSRLVYYRDGASATVSVQATNPGGTNDMFLKVNGKTDASTTGDMITQLMLGHLPLLLRPAVSQALVIGLGSGVTAGAVACHPSLQRLDVVEISSEVLQAARSFAVHNRNVLDDPRVRVVVEDAKSFLQITDRRYEVIISEPSNPWVAGVAGVFSLEFYQTCRAHLADDGIMVQWIHLYDFSDSSLEIVMATFAQVFPYVSVWQGATRDLLLVGWPQFPKPDAEGLASRLNEPRVKADLARLKLDNVPTFLAQETVSPLNGRFLAATDAPVHSDYFPSLEYRAQRDFFARSRAERWRQVDETFSPRATTLLTQWMARHPLGKEDYRTFAQFIFVDERSYVDLLGSLLLRWQQEMPGDMEPWEIGTRLSFLNPPGELEVLRLAPLRDRMVEQASADPQLLRRYGLASMRAYREKRSVFYQPPTAELEQVLARLIVTDPTNQRVFQLYLAELAWDKGDDEGCLELGRAGLAPDLPRGAAKFALDPLAPCRTVARMAESLWRRGELGQASVICAEAIRAGFLSEKTRQNSMHFEAVGRKILADVVATKAGRPQ